MSLDRWTHPVNWSSPFEEEIAFLTEIIESRDGSEQRIAQRVNPRISYRWQSVAARAAYDAVELRAAAGQGREITFDHPFGGTIVGRFAEPLEVAAVTNTTVTFGVSVVAMPGENDDRSFEAATNTYRGRELFDVSPNWRGGVVTTFEQRREIHDTGRGVLDYTLPHGFTARVFRLRYLVRDEDTLDAILGCFYRARGRQRAFYAPAWVQSLNPVLPVTSGTNLPFAGRELYDAFADQPMYRHVRIRTRTNGTLLREVAGITLDGGLNSVLVLTSSVPAITAASLIEMHWLLRCRHESDRLAVDWITDSVGEVDLTLRALDEADA